MKTKWIQVIPFTATNLTAFLVPPPHLFFFLLIFFLSYLFSFLFFVIIICGEYQSNDKQ